MTASGENRSALDVDRLSGVWSATPTPFTERMEIDEAAVGRLVEHHLRLGVNGLFLCGTCGEGPWMTDAQKRHMVRRVAEVTAGRLVLAVQVTDNSAARILNNIDNAAEDGADIAVVAPPYFLLNATAANVARLYLSVVERSCLPIGVYDRGASGAVPVPNEILADIYGAEGVALVKDSSCDPERMRIALSCRDEKPALRLLTGYEFDCVSYLAAGYDGLLLGGGIFNGHLAGLIMAAMAQGDEAAAAALQQRMNELMWDVYGGKEIRCWLTGLKHLLVEMGVFGSCAGYLGYPLTDSCRQAIAAAVQDQAEVLLPGGRGQRG